MSCAGDEMSRILILGGGSAGTILANQLGGRRDSVTLLTASMEHLFQPALLYIALTGANANVVRDERRLVLRSVKLVQERVTKVDLNQKLVEGSSGERYTYDRLVLATGVRTDPEQIPGLPAVYREFGNYHSGIALAQRLWSALRNFDGGTIALGQSTPICVCPPSPVEGILLLDRLLRRRGLRHRTRLVLFTPYPRAYPAQGINSVIEPLLKERGIEVMTFFDLDRIDTETKVIHSIEGDEITYDLPIIIPPFFGPDINFEPSEVADPSGFLLTDRETLRVKGFDSVYAIGDASSLPTSKAGVGAHLEAKVVARALRGDRAIFNGRTNCPMDLGDGRGTFVIGSYRTPVVPYRPSRLNLLMKHAMARMYWASLRGTLEPIFDLYFWLTTPERLSRRRVSKGA